MTVSAYPIFPVFAFMGFVLAIVPLPWHFEAWNSATCYYMIWASLACLNQFVNSVVWANSALNFAPIWCDISTRIIIGASVGLPAASMCINRRLYKIARVQAVTVTRAEKRRAILIDTLICVAFPIMCMVFAFIVQGHRFNIYEEIGCSPATYNTLAAYFLVNWWPVVIGLISAVYCILSLRAFAIRRSQFNQFLSSRNSSLTFGRYFRLMALATTEMLLTIPISSYLIYLNATTEPVEPWVSWSYVHSNFSRVEEVPAVIWKLNHHAAVALRLGQWLNPVCAFIFFAYFGLASEARRHYKLAFWFVVRTLGLSRFFAKKIEAPSKSVKFAHPNKTTSSDLLPTYSPPSPKSGAILGFTSLPPADVSEKASFVQVANALSAGDGYADSPSLPLSPSTPISPASEPPPNSAFSSTFDHSIAFTEIESLYGSRITSLGTLEVDASSESPPFPHSASNQV